MRVFDTQTQQNFARAQKRAVMILWAACGLCCQTASPAPHNAAGERWSQTSHFEIRWKPADATEAEVRAVETRAEGAWRGLETLLGSARMARQRLVVRLAGDAKPGEVPTVSPETGELIMVRFDGNGGGYEASLAHELVHALRLKLTLDRARQTDVYLFLEEGLAELLATEVGFPSTGFPTYGFPIPVVAGTWVANGDALPMAALVRQHRALNFRCMPQAYSQRLSFMTYLVTRVGLQAIIALAYLDQPLTSQDLERVTGEPLDTTATAWSAWALAAYQAVPDAGEKAKAYRQSPIRYLQVCNPQELP